MTYYTPDQWRGVALGKDGRNALRAAVAAHPGWSGHRAAYGLSDTGQLLTDELINVALALAIDIGAITGRTPDGAAARDADDHHKPRPHDRSEVRDLAHRLAMVTLDARADKLCNAILATIQNKQDGRATAKQFNCLTRALERAESRAATPATPAAEKPVMNAHSPATPAAGDAAHQLAGLITQLAGQAMNPEQVARIVDERINAALASVPSIKIECKGPDAVTRTVDGHQHPLFKEILTAATARDTAGKHPGIWLTGPAGSGKTTIAEMVAKALGLAFHFNGALSGPHEVLGYQDGYGVYHRTAFREAYENGGVYLFDECDGCADNSPLLALNAALANGSCRFPDATVARHPDFHPMAAANTHGLGATAEYVGRARIDGAFLDRFPIAFEVDYDEALEIAISGNERFARRVQKARAKARAAGLKILITPRASMSGAAMIAAGLSEDQAAARTYLARLTADQRRIVEA